MTKDERYIRRDRMRYTKNTLSSGLAIAAIVFNVFYFVSIYKSDVGSFYYDWLIGLSVVYNLLFMLIAFLSSEGVKNYKTGYAFVLLIIGVIQIGRIFIIPMKAHNAFITVNGEEIQVMLDTQYYSVIVFLVISAVCCIAAAFISFCRNFTLARHLASLNKKNA